MNPFIAEQLLMFRQTGAQEAARGRRLAGFSRAERPRHDRPRSRWAPRVGAAAAAVTMALVAVDRAHGRPDAGPSRAPIRSEAVVELVGLTAERVERVTYEPHAVAVSPAGEEIVGVAVELGTLTVYGPEAERQVYVAGDRFAAGWTALRTVNETDDPVVVLITIHGLPSRR